MMRNWLPSFRISRRMISIIFLNVAVITAAIFNHIYKVSHDTILNNLKENSRLLTLSTVHEVEKNLIAVQKVADNLAVTIQKRYKSSDDLEELLIMAVENNPEILGAAIAFEPGRKGQSPGTLYVGRHGNALYKTYTDPGNYDDHIRDWYSIPKELKKAMWSEPYYDELMPGVKKLTYSVPIYRNGDGTSQFMGILTADLSLEWLDNLVSSIKVCQTGYAYMISRNGSIICHPNKDYILNATIFSLAEETASPVLHEIGRNMVRGRSSFAEVEYHNLVTGKRSWVTYAPVKVSGWSLGIVYPVDELTAPLTDLSKTVMIYALIGAVILLFVIVLISRSITKPLRKLAFATRQISGGNFDAALPLVKTRDEIGDLTTSFGMMQRELRQTIDRLKAANDELENYSRTLEQKVESRTAELKERNAELANAMQNLKTLDLIGREITSTLRLEAIFATVYESVNRLLDATGFSIMALNDEEHTIECRLAIEKGERLPAFAYSMDDKNSFAVWCIENRKPVFINDVDREFTRYVPARPKPEAGTDMSSLMYLPLTAGDKVIGAISAQSFQKNAYTETHLDLLSNIASFAAIALDNAFAYESLSRAHEALKGAQAQLIQSEKMASLGQLTAGIAHEIKNPLNFINNFADLCVDLTKEVAEIIDKESGKLDRTAADYLREVLADLDQDVRKIGEHGRRADSIVKGMLLHSRGKSGEKQKTNLHDLIDEDLNLAYHGFRAQDADFNVKIKKEYDPTLEPVNVVPQDISRVLLNLLNNSFYAVNEKKKERKDDYNPTVVVSTGNCGDRVMVRVWDNGRGIAADVIDKVFNPFFTTKPTGKGTGLGLSLSYDIVVQEHRGEITVKSEPGEYTEFTVVLPGNL